MSDELGVCLVCGRLTPPADLVTQRMGQVDVTACRECLGVDDENEEEERTMPMMQDGGLPEITVRLVRTHDALGALWSVRAEAHGVGYNTTAYEPALEDVLDWTRNTLAYLMGRVAADQSGEEDTSDA